jgi:glutathione S-transferase
MPVTIIGNYLSPYVRKVLVCLELKGVEYELDPIIPFFGNDEFTRINPLRRIPVLLSDDLVLPESAVICEFLDERYPEPALMPAEPSQRARARALIAFADGRIGDVLIWRLFNQKIIKRFVWGEPADESILSAALNRELPALCDYLETLVPEENHLFGELGLVDIAIASPFRNASLVHCGIDRARWPRCGAYISRVLDHPAFARLRPFEELMLRTPIEAHREQLRKSGAPLSSSTFGGSRPRRGPLTVS